MKKVFFYTLGCKVNQYETEAMTELFEGAGYGVADSAEEADVIIVNSCTVTANSDSKTRQAVRKFKRLNPAATVVLCGCMPQAYPEKAADLIEADIVTGNKDHKKIIDLIDNMSTSQSQIVEIDEHMAGDPFEEFEVDNFTGRTRAFIKIQDGCNRFCSYCIIPTSRGRSRSRSLENLSLELDKIKSAGYREIVLVGINFCCYGLDIGKTFVDAIELACSKGFDRVRIGSLEFDNISDEAIERLSKLDNFCPQFHISLQSGCDRTLHAMNRHYTSDEYLELCTKLRNAFQDTTITTDFMVGFPEESDEDFRESLDFARKVGFEKMHVFPYSLRPGTNAAKLQQVPPEIRDKRAHIALELADELRHNFLENQIGKTVNVLFETTKGGYASGYTENYTPVIIKSDDESLQNTLRQVRLISVQNDNILGELE